MINRPPALDAASRMGPEPGLPYVLVADGDERRINACVSAVNASGCAIQVGRNSSEAVDILQRRGRAELVIVDLLLAPQDGPVVIEAARRLGYDGAAFIAWAPDRAVREFAACSLSHLDVRVLRGSAPTSVITRLVERVLRDRLEHDERRAAKLDDDTRAEETHEAMRRMQARARDISNAPGIAIYLRDGADQPYRSSGSWTPDEPIPYSLELLPHALHRVVETGEPFVALDTASEQLAESGTTSDNCLRLRGLVAVPIVHESLTEVIGMICAFDVKPLSMSVEQVEALKELGHVGLARHARRVAFAPRRIPSPPYAPLTKADPVNVRKELLDRSAGSAAVAREMERIREVPNRLSIVLFDVSRSASDPARAPAEGRIEEVGHLLNRAIRASDLTIRWSRSEMIVVLPGVGKTEADRVASRLRSAVLADSSGDILVAGGVAELGGDSLESLLARASRNMRNS